MNAIRLLVLDDYEGIISDSPGMQRIQQIAETTILREPLDPSKFAMLGDFHTIIAVRERTRLDVRFFQHCTSLELLLQTGGHAYHVDLTEATARGIVVALGRRITAPAIVLPELVFALLLGLVRKIYPTRTRMENGEWPNFTGSSLYGKTMGILGYGRIGRPVARMAQAFGMQVVAWDRSGESPDIDSHGVRFLPLEDLLQISDVVSVHLRLSSDSRRLLDSEKLHHMKPGAILINTSRGAIIDETALIDALLSSKISGAGLDVFENEPLAAASPLRKLPNVLVTPHIGWQVDAVFNDFISIAADQLSAWLEYKLSPDDVINPDAMRAQRPRHGGIGE